MVTQGQESSKEDEEEDQNKGKLNHKREISRENLQKLKKSQIEFKEDKAATGNMQSSYDQKKLKGEISISKRNNNNNHNNNLHQIDTTSQKHRKDNLAIQVENLQDNGDTNYVEQQSNSKSQRKLDSSKTNSNRSKGTQNPKQIQLFQSSAHSPLFQQITNFSQSPISLASKNDLDSSSQDELFSELRKSEVRLASLSLRFSLEGKQLFSLPPSPFFIRDRESQKNTVAIKSTKDSVVELGNLEYQQGFTAKNADKDQEIIGDSSSKHNHNDSSMNSEFINLYKTKDIEIMEEEQYDELKPQGQSNNNNNNLATQKKSQESHIILVQQQQQLQDKAQCFKKKKQDSSESIQKTSHLKQQRNLVVENMGISKNKNSNEMTETSEKSNCENGLSPLKVEFKVTDPSLKDLLLFNHGSVGVVGGSSVNGFVAPSGIDINPSTRQLATNKNISLIFDVSFDKEDDKDEDEEEELQKQVEQPSKQQEQEKQESQPSQHSLQKPLISSPSYKDNLTNLPKDEQNCTSVAPAKSVSQLPLTTPTPKQKIQTNKPGQFQDSPQVCPKNSGGGAGLCTPKQSSQSSKRNALLPQKQMQKISSTPSSVPRKINGFSQSPELTQSHDTKVFSNGNAQNNNNIINNFQNKRISGNNLLWNIKDPIPPNQRATLKQGIPLVNLASEEDCERDNNQKNILTQSYQDQVGDKKANSQQSSIKEINLIPTSDDHHQGQPNLMPTSDDLQGQRTAAKASSCLKKNISFSNKPIPNTKDNCLEQLEFQQPERASNSPQKRQGNNNNINTTNNKDKNSISSNITNILYNSAYSKQLFPESTKPNVLSQNTARCCDKQQSEKKQQPYMLAQADLNNITKSKYTTMNISSNNTKSKERLHKDQTDKQYYQNQQNHHHHSNKNSRDSSPQETQLSNNKPNAINTPMSNITCLKRDSQIQLSSQTEKSSCKYNSKSHIPGSHYLPDSFGRFRKTPDKRINNNNDDQQHQQQQQSQQQQTMYSTSMQQHKESSLITSNPISLANIIQNDLKSTSSRVVSLVELKRSLSIKQQEFKNNQNQHHQVIDQQIQKNPNTEKETRGSLGVKPHACQDQDLEKIKTNLVDKTTKYQQCDPINNKLSSTQSIQVIELSRSSSRNSSNTCMKSASSSPKKKLKNSLSVTALKQPRLNSNHGQLKTQKTQEWQSQSTQQISQGIYSAEAIIILDDFYRQQIKEFTSMNENKYQDQRIMQDSKKDAKSYRNEQDNHRNHGNHNIIKNNSNIFEARNTDDSQVDSSSWRVSGQPTSCNSNRSSNLSNGYRLIKEQKQLSLSRQVLESSRLAENGILNSSTNNNNNSATSKRNINQQSSSLSDQRHACLNQRQSVDSPQVLTTKQILARQLKKQSEQSQQPVQYLNGKNADVQLLPTYLKLRDITSSASDQLRQSRESSASSSSVTAKQMKKNKTTNEKSNDHLRESFSSSQGSFSGQQQQQSQTRWIDSIKEDYYPVKKEAYANDNSKKKFDKQSSYMRSSQSQEKQECISSCLDQLSSKLNLLQLTSTDGSYYKNKNNTKISSDQFDRKQQEQSSITPHRNGSNLNERFVNTTIAGNSYSKRGSDGCVTNGNIIGRNNNINKNQSYADMQQMRTSFTKTNNYIDGQYQQLYQHISQEILPQNDSSKLGGSHSVEQRQVSILQCRSAKIRN